MKNLESLHCVKVFKVNDDYQFRVEVTYNSENKVLEAKSFFDAVPKAEVSIEILDAIHVKSTATRTFFNMINSWCKETAFSGITEKLKRNLEEEFGSLK